MILADYSNAGDGLITSLQVLSVFGRKPKKASEVFDLFKPFPQSLINIDAQKCNDFEKSEQIKNMLEDVQHSLNGSGRILYKEIWHRRRCKING